MSQPAHEATLLASSRPSGGLLRLELALLPESGFRASGLADDWLRLAYPGPGGSERLVTLSLRRQSGAVLTLDIALHPGSPLCAWALGARPGARLRVSDASGLYQPGPAGWQILLADLAGLPAAARILEEMPEGCHCRAFLEVPGRSERSALSHPASAEITWIHGGNGQAPGRLADLLARTPLPDGPGYIWAGAEQGTARALRRQLRGRADLRHTILAYWIEGAEAWRDGWDALPQATRSRIDAIWESPLAPEDIQLEVDRALEAHGL